MRVLIAVLFFLSTLIVIAQDKANESGTVINDQSDKWMTIIASSSVMRGKMMDMMIKETQGDDAEIMKLVNLLINNQKFSSKIFSLQSGEKEPGNMSIEPRGIKSDSVKSDKVYKLQPMRKKN